MSDYNVASADDEIVILRSAFSYERGQYDEFLFLLCVVGYTVT